MRRFPKTPQWLRIPESASDSDKLKIMRSRVNDILKWLEEVEHLPFLTTTTAVTAPTVAETAHSVTGADGVDLATLEAALDALGTKINEYRTLLVTMGLPTS